uniref:Uncharacterized protein n=1 Tax=Moniliophthora roreri TaxID=221103 RepID=A0A0W0G513_MONRR
MDPLPYNITIPAQSSAIEYFPGRADNDTLEGGWNATYTHGRNSNYQGIGDSYLQTAFLDTSMSLTWVGTAMYLYGNSTDSVDIEVDGTRFIDVRPNGDLLYRATGLPYGSHKIVLKHRGSGTLAIHHAILTIGIGYQEYDVLNRSVSAVIDGQPNDAFFEFQNVASDSTRWGAYTRLKADLPNGGQKPIPDTMGGSVGSSTGLAFNLTNSSAFFIRGFAGRERQAKIATLTPGLKGESSKITMFNDFSPLYDYDQVLYWERGTHIDPHAYSVSFVYYPVY